MSYFGKCDFCTYLAESGSGTLIRWYCTRPALLSPLLLAESAVISDRPVEPLRMTKNCYYGPSHVRWVPLPDGTARPEGVSDVDAERLRVLRNHCDGTARPEGVSYVG